MSGSRPYQSLRTLVTRLRDDLNQRETESNKKVINKPATTQRENEGFEVFRGCASW